MTWGQSPSKRIIGHYQTHACAWDADRRAGGWPDKIWHDRFIAALAPGGSVLDLGCGGGAPVAVHLAAAGLRVTGIDSAPALITLCRERLPAHEFITADMRDTALDRKFNGILAWDSFFHLDPGDQRRMIPVFATLAAPAAILMFNTGPRHGEAIGTYRGDPLYHASLAPEEYTTRLQAAGFTVLAHVIEDPEAGGRTVWLARAGG